MAARGKYQCPYCSRQSFKNRKEYLAHLSMHRDRRDKMSHPGYISKRRFP